MIIGISGSVGSGKTTLAKELSKRLNGEVLHLNELAQKYKVKEVKELQTMDFDFDRLLEEVEDIIMEHSKNKNNTLILESHFTHHISPNLLDKVLIITRPLQELNEEYLKRGYNEQKIKDNLEVESFNNCYFEALEEGHSSENVMIIENSNTKTFDEVLEDVLL